MGNKTVYELKTASGRSVNTTATHPYLVKLYSKEECGEYANTVWNKNHSIDEFEDNGYCTRWVEVKYLQEGMEIATPILENEGLKKDSDNLVGFIMVSESAKDDSASFELEHQDKASNVDSFVLFKYTFYLI